MDLDPHIDPSPESRPFMQFIFFLWILKEGMFGYLKHTHYLLYYDFENFALGTHFVSNTGEVLTWAFTSRSS